ncbi:hypothetical protein N8532_01420, partial [Akkermansiaceae bacterium]|nr:hypothetical protein [Akkermansiaceae bacterium]
FGNGARIGKGAIRQMKRRIRRVHRLGRPTVTAFSAAAAGVALRPTAGRRLATVAGQVTPGSVAWASVS